MTDSKPGDKPASYPIYSVEPHGRPNPTGTSKAYMPKVHSTDPHQPVLLHDVLWKNSPPHPLGSCFEGHIVMPRMLYTYAKDLPHPTCCAPT